VPQFRAEIRSRFRPRGADGTVVIERGYQAETFYVSIEIERDTREEKQRERERERERERMIATGSLTG